MEGQPMIIGRIGVAAAVLVSTSLLPRPAAPGPAEAVAAAAPPRAAQRVALGQGTLAWGAGGRESGRECRDVPEWAAQRRYWMRTAGVAWCSVEVSFRYDGGAGEVKMVVSKESASGRAAILHASAHMPGNGGEQSPFQFIFPCPAPGVARLCLGYAATAAAGELHLDSWQLGVDAGSAPAGQFVHALLSPEESSRDGHDEPLDGAASPAAARGTRPGPGSAVEATSAASIPGGARPHPVVVIERLEKFESPIDVEWSLGLAAKATPAKPMPPPLGKPRRRP
jgi:hypothetical protein